MIRFVCLCMRRYEVETVGSLAELAWRLRKAGHEVEFADGGSLFLVPFEGHAVEEVQRAGIEAHFGCELRLVL